MSTSSDIKKLYALSAGKCNICQCELFANDVHIGQMAHVIAKNCNGPRGDSNVTNNNDYNNLILLCANHHIEVDSNLAKYTIGKLDEIKLNHELKISKLLNAEVSNSGNIPMNEDVNRVREYLDKFSTVFKELFSSGSEAGYFFPVYVYDFVHNFYSSKNDWEENRVLSSNPEIMECQHEIRNLLIEMVNLIDSNDYYDRLGLSYKFKIPYDITNRNEIINEKRNDIGALINKLASFYTKLRNYAITGS